MLMSEKKRQIGALDFNDIERLALDALSAVDLVDCSAVGADETMGQMKPQGSLRQVI
jgi:hypothetical protein